MRKVIHRLILRCHSQCKKCTLQKWESTRNRLIKRLDSYSATLPASMGGNKTPIIDEHELYDGAKPWVENKFFGSQSIKYTQIGNAVPCNLAKAVVKMVIDILEEKRHIIPIAYDQQIKFL